MAETEVQEEQVVEIQENFYRDSFNRVILVICGILVAIGFLIATSIYLHLNIPPPKTFPVQDEWRVQKSVPLSDAYLLTSDLLQWVSNVLPKAFRFDFINYNEQLKDASQFFTPEGWKVFLNQLNIYANYTKVQQYKMFVSAAPDGAPIIINQGPVQETGVYGWWVKMPLIINYMSYSGSNSQTVTLQVLVVRVSTLNNLNGVAINNVLVVKGSDIS